MFKSIMATSAFILGFSVSSFAQMNCTKPPPIATYELLRSKCSSSTLPEKSNCQSPDVVLAKAKEDNEINGLTLSISDTLLSDSSCGIVEQEKIVACKELKKLGKKFCPMPEKPKTSSATYNPNSPNSNTGQQPNAGGTNNQSPGNNNENTNSTANVSGGNSSGSSLGAGVFNKETYAYGSKRTVFEEKDANGNPTGVVYERYGNDVYKIEKDGTRTPLSKEDAKKFKEIEEKTFQAQEKKAKEIENAYKTLEKKECQGETPPQACKDAKAVVDKICDELPDSADKEKCKVQASKGEKDAQLASQDLESLKQTLQQIINEANQANAKASQTPPCPTLPQAAASALTRLEKETQDLHKACASNSGTASWICPLTVSPTAIMVSGMMNVAQGIIDGSNASKTCETTSRVNGAAQSLMAAGAVVCGITKGICENKCQLALGSLNLIKQQITSAQGSCPTMNFENQIASVQKTDQGKFEKCEKHKIDVAQMMGMVANLGAAFAQAKQCSNAIASEDGSGSPSYMSQQTMCSDPANANSLTCRCMVNPMGEGCPGVGNNGAGSNYNKTASTKGPSQMASLNANTKLDSGNLGSLSDGGFGDESSSYFGSGNDANGMPKGFGAASNAGGGGGGGGRAGNSSGTESDQGALNAATNGATGGAYKGGGFGGRAGLANKNNNAKQSKKFSDAVNNLRRKLAGQQAQQQVSSSSGISNWDKIKTRYLEKKSTLIGN